MYPTGIAVHPNGNFLFVTDTEAHTIRRVDIETKEITTIAGQHKTKGMKDGFASQSLFCGPRGIAFSKRPFGLFVSDTLNHAVRFITLDKSSAQAISVTTVCGGKTNSKQIRFPDGIVVSEDCIVFVNDLGIGKIVPCAVSSHDDTTSTFSRSTNDTKETKISPSTMLDDLKRTIGDKTLPQGRVTFVVGPERQRIEHISKNILCVRSELFMKMFRARNIDVADDEIVLPSDNYRAYEEMIQYLVTDSVQSIDRTSIHDRIELLSLATKMRIPRLVSICVASMKMSSLEPSEVLSALDTISVLLAKQMMSSGDDGGDDSDEEIEEEEEDNDSDSQGDVESSNRAKEKKSPLFSLLMETRCAVVNFARTNPDALRSSLTSVKRVEVCRGILSDILLDRRTRMGAS